MRPHELRPSNTPSQCVGKLIGGASDVDSLYQSGELQQLLRTNEEL